MVGIKCPHQKKGKIMEIKEITQKLRHTLPPAERDALIKENRKKDDKLMKGMFEFIDAQGGFLEFSYRKYPGETIKVIKLIHGEICVLLNILTIQRRRLEGTI